MHNEPCLRWFPARRFATRSRPPSAPSYERYRSTFRGHPTDSPTDRRTSQFRPGSSSPPQTSAAFAATASRRTSPSVFLPSIAEIPTAETSSAPRDAAQPELPAVRDLGSTTDPGTRTCQEKSPAPPAFYFAMDYSISTPFLQLHFHGHAQVTSVPQFSFVR